MLPILWAFFNPTSVLVAAFATEFLQRYNYYDIYENLLRHCCCIVETQNFASPHWVCRVSTIDEYTSLTFPVRRHLEPYTGIPIRSVHRIQYGQSEDREV